MPPPTAAATPPQHPTHPDQPSFSGSPSPPEKTRKKSSSPPRSLTQQEKDQRSLAQQEKNFQSAVRGAPIAGDPYHQLASLKKQHSQLVGKSPSHNPPPGTVARLKALEEQMKDLHREIEKAKTAKTTILEEGGNQNRSLDDVLEKFQEFKGRGEGKKGKEGKDDPKKERERSPSRASTVELHQGSDNSLNSTAAGPSSSSSAADDEPKYVHKDSHVFSPNDVAMLSGEALRSAMLSGAKSRKCVESLDLGSLYVWTGRTFCGGESVFLKCESVTMLEGKKFHLLCRGTFCTRAATTLIQSSTKNFDMSPLSTNKSCDTLCGVLIFFFR